MTRFVPWLLVALCFVLVCGCLVSLRGLQHALSMPLGFEPRGVVVAGFELGLAGYTPERGSAFQKHALEAVERLPGVESAAYSNSLPLTIDQSSTILFREDQVHPKPSDGVPATFYQLSPGVFRTIKARLLAGRDEPVVALLIGPRHRPSLRRCQGRRSAPWTPSIQRV